MKESLANTALHAQLSATALLERSRDLCMPRLREAVSRLASPMDMVAAYHFGWTDRHGKPTIGDGGKMVRPALAALSAQAVGGDPAAGSLGGVAVELVHNFSLLHDDFMDGDQIRRNRATAWTVFNPTLAILTGDALLMLASEVLLNSPAHSTSLHDRARAAQRLTTASRRLIDGQASDLSFEHRDRITIQNCLEMEGKKTGALLACASAVGAVLAGADDATADALGRYGHHLGLAFQAVDDVLGIWSDPEVTGKPRWGDLRRRKKSLPVCAALAEGGTASQRLADLLAATHNGDHEDEQQLAEQASLIEAAGGRAWAEGEARRQHDKAIAGLDEVTMPEGVRASFVTLAEFVVNRKR
ncbi:polyprenyl synthetase family protein [Streptomyces sp. NPDC004787]|uniref:polyprenyl synthetase family protein n=1 Tax=Streptomyces sp. NPDC004787 TaxID=3154291 RepID=UPI0033BBF4D6